jgi:hypothetical protein
MRTCSACVAETARSNPRVKRARAAGPNGENLCFYMKLRSTKIRPTPTPGPAHRKLKVQQWRTKYEVADRAIHRSRFTMCQWQRPGRLARCHAVSSIFRAVTSLLHSKSTPTESFSAKNARTVSGSLHTKLKVLNSRTVRANMSG